MWPKSGNRWPIRAPQGSPRPVLEGSQARLGGVPGPSWGVPGTPGGVPWGSQGGPRGVSEASESVSGGFRVANPDSKPKTAPADLDARPPWGAEMPILCGSGANFSIFAFSLPRRFSEPLRLGLGGHFGAKLASGRPLGGVLGRLGGVLGRLGGVLGRLGRLLAALEQPGAGFGLQNGRVRQSCLGAVSELCRRRAAIAMAAGGDFWGGKLKGTSRVWHAANARRGRGGLCPQSGRHRRAP